MAAGGLSGKEKQLKLPSGIQLTICQDDITHTSAIALATGEDAEIRGMGLVSKMLLELCPKAYKNERDKMKKAAKKIEFGKVYSCPSGKNGSRAGKVSFDTVYHAVVPPKIQISSTKDWQDCMERLYFNLFNAVNRDGKKSLALPLMGSGGAGASFDVAVEPLSQSLVKFHHKSGSALQFITVHVRADEAFRKLEAGIKGKLKRLSAPASPGNAKQKDDGDGDRRSTSSHMQMAKADLKPRDTDGTPASTSTVDRKGAEKKHSKRDALRGKSIQETTAHDCSNLLIILGSTPASHVSGSGETGLEKRLSSLTLRENVQVSDTTSGSDGSDKDGTKETKKNGDVEDSDNTKADVDGVQEARDGKGDTDSASKAAQEDEEDNKCPICLDEMDSPKKLEKCGHTFCKNCIEGSFLHHKPVCPTCNTAYGIIRGNQPKGTMEVHCIRQHLPGYEQYGTIVILYTFPSGQQGKEHPNPGQPYTGTSRRAYLPKCPEGIKVCRLLQVAFDNRLTFTIGRSVTTGAENTVTWNDIHHKTNMEGGPTGFGYPDPQYLSRVQEELAARGVTEECFKDSKLNFYV